VAQRLRHLQALVRAGGGDAGALQSLQRHLACMRRTGLAADERQGRLDTALTAVVARDAEMARTVLEPLSAHSGSSPARRWTFELSYCLAKVCELSGRTAESLKHYQRYAHETVQCVRAEWPVEVAASRAGTAGDSPVKDDIEMSLPAKYRRAYRYLLDHLERNTLSVREIAECVGVTERALQSVFRTHVGMTPAEVIRRCRVERIREDLVKGNWTGRTVLEAGARWGIGNRSTLIASYRRHFSETPAETLQRLGEPSPAARPAVATLAAAA
jgi:AraC-like DNA-binding protein